MKIKLAALAAAIMLVAPVVAAQGAVPPELSVGRPKLNKQKGTATIPATVNEAGGLSVREPMNDSIWRYQVDTVDPGGTYVLKIVPKRKLRRELRREGSVKIRVSVVFEIQKAATTYTANAVFVNKTITLKRTLHHHG